MICSSCDSSIPDGSGFCNRCGKPLAIQVSPPQTEAQPQAQSTPLPSFLQGIIALKPEESIVRIWHGSRLARVQGGKGGQGGLDEGYFVASNQRMYFIGRSVDQTFLRSRKTFAVVETIAYENIKGMAFRDAWVYKGLTINYEKGEDTRTLTAVALSEIDSGGNRGHQVIHREGIERIMSDLSLLVQNRLHEVEEKDRGKNRLDFSLLKAGLEKGGIVVQMIKCPSCASWIPFPAVGGNPKCRCCGGVLSAMDVLERMTSIVESF